MPPPSLIGLIIKLNDSDLNENIEADNTDNTWCDPVYVVTLMEYV